MTDVLTQFIHKFDLEPKGYRAVVTEWDFVYDRIVITNIDIYDLDGNFIRAADMNNISKNMDKFAFSFKKPV